MRKWILVSNTVGVKWQCLSATFESMGHIHSAQVLSVV